MMVQVMAVVCGLPRLAVQDLSMAARRAARTYGALCASKVEPNVLRAAWVAIDARVGEVAAFMDQWLSYHALWDMNASAVVRRLNWEARAGALERFVQAEGHAKVPAAFETEVTLFDALVRLLLLLFLKNHRLSSHFHSFHS